MGTKMTKMVRVKNGKYIGEIGKVVGVNGDVLLVEFTTLEKEWINESELDIK